MEELKEYAMHLNSHGFAVNIDQIDERLNHLSLTKSKVVEPEVDNAEPMMGFMETDPEKFKNDDTETGDRHKRLRRAMATDLERNLSNL